MFTQMDKALHGAETGTLTKPELRTALDSFFQVGQPGGKTLNRFDELMQVGCCLERPASQSLLASSLACMEVQMGRPLQVHNGNESPSGATLSRSGWGVSGAGGGPGRANGGPEEAL